MSGFGFFTFVCCCCVANIKGEGCLGDIISPAEGTTYYFTPGSTGNLTWKFTCDNISCVESRVWEFTPRDASSDKKRTLASITKNDRREKCNTTGLSFEIEKPSTLLLKNVNRSYSGTYEFSVLATSMNDSRVEVFITDAPIVNLSCPGRNEVNESDNFICECRGVGGNLSANVTWYKGVVQISETKKENNTLNLYDVNGTDSGNYTCVAQSYPTEAFKDEKSFELIVRFASTTTQPPTTTHGPPIGAIVGGVVGGLIGFILLVIIVCVLVFHYKDRGNSGKIEDENADTAHNADKKDVGPAHNADKKDVGPAHNADNDDNADNKLLDEHAV